MNENDCVLIKNKDLEALKEPYYVAKKEFDLSLKEQKKLYQEEETKLRNEIYELKMKIKNNPPSIDPMKIKIIFEDYNRERNYNDRTTPYNYIDPVNIKLDQPLHRQINRILSSFSEKLFNKSIEKSEEIKKINIKTLTEEVQKKCYTEVSNMEYFERRNFLKKFKIKRTEKV